jgi:hypothetical protein
MKGIVKGPAEVRQHPLLCEGSDISQVLTPSKAMCTCIVEIFQTAATRFQAVLAVLHLALKGRQKSL